MGKCHECRESRKCHNKRKCHKNCRAGCKNRIPCRPGDENWLQFGKTLANTRNANCEKKINRHNVTQLVQKWYFSPDASFPGLKQPGRYEFTGISVEGNCGYGAALNDFGVGNQALAVKLNLTDGSAIWGVGTGLPVNPVPEFDSGIRFPPAIGKDLVYFGLRGVFDENPFVLISPCKIVALRKNDGSLAWQASLHDNPLVTNGISQPTSPIIYVEEDNIVIQATVALEGNTFGSVQAFDATTGAQLWAFKTTEGSMPGINEGGPGCSIFGPGAVDTKRKLVYYGTGQNNNIDFPNPDPVPYPVSDLQDSILALNYLTGEFVWKKQFTTDDIGLWPVGDCFYSTTLRPDGSIDFPGYVKNWDMAGGPHLDTICIDGKKRDVVVAGSKSGRLYILDRESPTQEGVLYEDYLIIPPAPTGSSNQGFNYCGCTDGKYWYFLAMYSNNGRPAGLGNGFAPPQFISTDTALLKINPKNGEILWRTEFSGTHVAPPAFANGVVYFNLLQGAKLGLPLEFETPVGTSLIAVDACTGEPQLINFAGDLLMGDVQTSGSPVSIKDGVVYSGRGFADRGVYAYALSGEGYPCSSKSASKSAVKKSSEKADIANIAKLDLANLTKDYK